jgi:hypothetical protein
MKRVLVLFVVGVVLFGVCSAQNANAQNANIAQRIIDTWVDHDGNTWVFNANGTVTKNSVSSKFGVTDTQLFIAEMDEVFNISISSDGRTLIMLGEIKSDFNARTGVLTIFRTRFWMTKK